MTGGPSKNDSIRSEDTKVIVHDYLSKERSKNVDDGKRFELMVAKSASDYFGTPFILHPKVGINSSERISEVDLASENFNRFSCLSKISSHDVIVIAAKSWGLGEWNENVSKRSEDLRGAIQTLRVFRGIGMRTYIVAPGSAMGNQTILEYFVNSPTYGRELRMSGVGVLQFGRYSQKLTCLLESQIPQPFYYIQFPSGVYPENGWREAKRLGVI
jgi:hypothetical protein